MNNDTISNTLIQKFKEKDRFRVGQRYIVPSAVKSEKLSNIIFGATDAVGVALSSNGAGFDINISLTQNKKYEIQGLPYISLYVGSVSNANQFFPGVGASQDIKQWQITGPSYNWDRWNANGYPRHVDYTTLRVENISAGNVNVIIRANWRYISPREN